MELPLQPAYVLLSMLVSFNPCFNGTPSATSVNFPVLWYRVSILVLMELPLQQTISDYELETMSFNPCFNGTSSATS